jgi:hypothetical protein
MLGTGMMFGVFSIARHEVKVCLRAELLLRMVGSRALCRPQPVSCRPSARRSWRDARPHPSGAGKQPRGGRSTGQGLCRWSPAQTPRPLRRRQHASRAATMGFFFLFFFFSSSSSSSSSLACATIESCSVCPTYGVSQFKHIAKIHLDGLSLKCIETARFASRACMIEAVTGREKRHLCQRLAPAPAPALLSLSVRLATTSNVAVRERHIRKSVDQRRSQEFSKTENCSPPA